LVARLNLQSKNNKIEVSKVPATRAQIMPHSKRKESTNKKPVYALQAATTVNPMSQSQLFKKYSKVIKRAMLLVRS